MAYVRQKANQLLIVHGERDWETGKVQQHVLFTLYSKAEALEAIGRTSGKRDWQFRKLLENQYPDIRFDWDKLSRQIHERMGNLPDLWDYGTNRLRRGFRKSIVDFARHLLLADPQTLTSSKALLQEYAHELEYIQELIELRLKTMSMPSSEFDEDTTFYWRYLMQGRSMPGDEEECIEGMWQKGETEKAETLFRLMIECFDDYAEGHNYLGLMALDRGDSEEALACFQRTMELGEKQFPKRLPKKSYWRDYRTRPFMRGVFNSIRAMLRLGRFPDALELADALEERCGDKGMANHYRAKVYLNKGEWQDALDCAQQGRGGGEAFMAAIAAHELRQDEEALVFYLQGALHRPRTARMLAHKEVGPLKQPGDYDEHNLAVALFNDLAWYFDTQDSSDTLFHKMLDFARIRDLLDEVETLEATGRTGDETSRRRARARREQMQTKNFARVEAMNILRL